MNRQAKGSDSSMRTAPSQYTPRTDVPTHQGIGRNHLKSEISILGFRTENVKGFLCPGLAGAGGKTKPATPLSNRRRELPGWKH